jgi:membrane-bound serine protease (ClpP class)
MEALASVLIMLGLLAIAFDLHVTMHGLLAAVGIAAVALGMAWLVWLALPPIIALTVAALIGAVALRIGRPIFRAMRELLERAPQPEFLSDVARAVEDLRPAGLVRIDGMLWRAVSVAGPAAPGEAVRILARRELSLMVAPLSSQEATWQTTTL